MFLSDKTNAKFQKFKHFSYIYICNCQKTNYVKYEILLATNLSFWENALKINIAYLILPYILPYILAIKGCVGISTKMSAHSRKEKG